MPKKIILLFVLLFTLLFSSQVSAATAQITPVFDKETGELVSFDYPVSATKAKRDTNIWKYSVEKVHFNITLKDGTTKKVAMDYDEISKLDINSVNYGGRLDSYVSVGVNNYIFSQLDAETVNLLKSQGYTMSITSTIYVKYYDKNGDEDLSKRVVCNTLAEIVAAMKAKGFSKLHQDDMKMHFPTGKISAPPVTGGDLILSKFTYPKRIMLGTSYSYSYLAQNTFIEDKVSNLYAKIQFKNQSGSVVYEETDDIIPYGLAKGSSKSEGANFKVTDTQITSATIKIHLTPIANEYSTANNNLEATIPVFDPNNITNLKANYYSGETNVNSNTSSMTVGANVTNESKNSYTGVEFEVRVNGKLEKTFKADIAGNSTRDYNTTITTPSTGAHKITITVNPKNNNPVEFDTSDNTVVGNILVSPNGGNFDLVAVSYDGETSIPKLQKNIQVVVTINNKSSTTDYNENININFGGKDYVKRVSLNPGQHKYNLGMVPSTNIVGNSNMTITVNPDNNPKEIVFGSDNILVQNINIFDSSLPPTPQPPTFDMYLDINNSGNEATVKSGYGIPIEIEITNFTHYYNNIYTDNQLKLDKSKTQIVNNYKNFNINSSSKAEVLSNTAKGFTFSRIPDGKYTLTKASMQATDAAGETAIIQLTEVNGKRHIYTDPSLPNGTYEIIVDVEINATWEEQYRWWNPHNSSSRTCGKTSHSHSASCYDSKGVLDCGKPTHTHTGSGCTDQPSTVALSESHTKGCYTYTGGWNYFWSAGSPIFKHQQLKGIIHINGSMYDDDQTIISR